MRYHSFDQFPEDPAFHGRGGMRHRSRRHFHRWFSHVMGPNQRVERGEIRYLILDALSDKVRHGYDIIQEIERGSEGFYKPSTGVLYPTLQALEDDGYIYSRKEDGRKLFELTEDGREELERNRDYVAEIYGRLSWPSSFFHDENIMGVSNQIERLLRLLRFSIFSYRGKPNDQTEVEEIQSILRDAAEKIQKVIQREER